MTFDNLSSGHRDAVLGGEFFLGDLADQAALDAVFVQHRPDAVMHFASFIQVGESVRRPDMYYRNNFSNTLNLLDAMVAHDVKHFIFSSTAAVFGEPDYVPIDEAHGRIATTMFVVYPPGIASIVPGERLDKRAQPMLDYLKMFERSANLFPGFDVEIQGIYRETAKDGVIRFHTYVVRE